MRIAIGCDEAAFALKEEIKKFLQEQGDVPIEVEDFGGYSMDPVDYPDIAVKVAEAVAENRCERGILLCGTGIGMAITANKVPGIRAALCHDTYSAERAQKSNDAQILTMGARVVGPELAKKIVTTWLQSRFGGGGVCPKGEQDHGGGTEAHRKHLVTRRSSDPWTDGTDDHEP